MSTGDHKKSPDEAGPVSERLGDALEFSMKWIQTVALAGGAVHQLGALVIFQGWIRYLAFTLATAAKRFGTVIIQIAHFTISIACNRHPKIHDRLPVSSEKLVTVTRDDGVRFFSDYPKWAFIPAHDEYPSHRQGFEHPHRMHRS